MDNAGEPWSIEEQTLLVELFQNGGDVGSISKALGRTELAIRSRLGKLGLLAELAEEDVRRIVAGDLEVGWDGRGPLKTTSKKTHEMPLELPTLPVCEGMFSVYSLVNSEHCVYIGYSAKLDHRISQHNADNGAIATKGRGPWVPFAVYHYMRESDARQAETHFRRYPDEIVLRCRDSLIAALHSLGVIFDEDRLSFL